MSWLQQKHSGTPSMSGWSGWSWGGGGSEIKSSNLRWKIRCLLVDHIEILKLPDPEFPL